MKPFSVLAPMEDVTDTVFRQMVGRIAPPDRYMTEFTSIDGIVHNAPHPPLNFSQARGCAVRGGVGEGDIKSNPVLRRLIFSENERPIEAQIWGNDPEKFYEAASFIDKLNFDGININMGCPQREIMKCGGGAALIGDDVSVRVRVSEIIEAVKRAAPKLPISVKTRLGNKKIMTKEWIGFLLEQNLAAITVHLRTAAEQSGVPAHWEEMKKIIIMSRECKCKIIGNGDVRDYQDGVKRCEEYGGDGFMIGRGILTNPAAFDKNGRQLSREERCQLLIDHTDLWEKTWGSSKDFKIMRKFVKAYINGFDGAARLRARLMEAESREELVRIIEGRVK